MTAQVVKYDGQRAGAWRSAHPRGGDLALSWGVCEQRHDYCFGTPSPRIIVCRPVPMKLIDSRPRRGPRVTTVPDLSFYYSALRRVGTGLPTPARELFAAPSNPPLPAIPEPASARLSLLED